MRVLISGAGIAGLSLGLCLSEKGHDVVICERSPALRTAGYMLDFFGPGYEAAGERIFGGLRARATIVPLTSKPTYVESSGTTRWSKSAASRPVPQPNSTTARACGKSA